MNFVPSKTAVDSEVLAEAMTVKVKQVNEPMIQHELQYLYTLMEDKMTKIIDDRFEKGLKRKRTEEEDIPQQEPQQQQQKQQQEVKEPPLKKQTTQSFAINVANALKNTAMYGTSRFKLPELPKKQQPQKEPPKQTEKQPQTETKKLS